MVLPAAGWWHHRPGMWFPELTVLVETVSTREKPVTKARWNPGLYILDPVNCRVINPGVTGSDLGFWWKSGIRLFLNLWILGPLHVAAAHGVGTIDTIALLQLGIGVKTVSVAVKTRVRVRYLGHNFRRHISFKYSVWLHLLYWEMVHNLHKVGDLCSKRSCEFMDTSLICPTIPHYSKSSYFGFYWAP